MFKTKASFIMRLAVAALAVTVMSAASVRADVQLMMAEEPGCVWCARWNAEIGAIYPKTDEGVAAPLRRVNLLDPLPADIVLARRINYTPTFVLLVEGVEINRIEGYPGEDFFWGILARMLEQQGIVLAKAEK
jgi:thioredoxin-related protein